MSGTLRRLGLILLLGQAPVVLAESPLDAQLLAVANAPSAQWESDVQEPMALWAADTPAEASQAEVVAAAVEDDSAPSAVVVEGGQRRLSGSAAPGGLGASLP